MSEEKTMRLNQAARKFNVSTSKIIDSLSAKGFKIDNNPNFKLNQKEIEVLEKEFKTSLLEKEEATYKSIGSKNFETIVQKGNELYKKETVQQEDAEPEEKNFSTPVVTPEKVEKEPATEENASNKLAGLKVVGKIELTPKKKPITKTQPVVEEKKKQHFSSQKDFSNKKKDFSSEKKHNPKQTTPTTTITSKKEEKKEPVPQQIPQKKEEPVVISKVVELDNEPEAIEIIKAKADQLGGLKVLGKIDLPTKKPATNTSDTKTKDAKDQESRRKKRNRIKKPKTVNETGSQQNNNASGDNRPNTGTPINKDAKKPDDKKTSSGNNNNRDNRGDHKKKFSKEEPSQKEIQEQIKATMARMSGGGKKKSIKKVLKRDREDASQESRDESLIRVTEFISTSDLASLMNVPINEVISKCLGMGMFVSINQRLDAEAITIIADEFNFKVEFISADEEVEEVVEQEDSEDTLEPRPPIVTVMGHVDHGKTSLLDYIRRTNVAAKESGGITQHIGAYKVMTENKKEIAFLDTPGHEAFTAMRARGAKLTDVAIIVVAADDNVMPQTREAINHAQLANVPIVVAISKIDKPTANSEKVKEQLAKENILVEDWGGKYQCQEISSKSGLGIPELLEKVLLEAELLDLKANPDKKAQGAVIEASLDKGRGYVTNLLVQSGTLKIGDIILVGSHYGRVKAMTDHTGKPIKKAGPSTPVQILGLSGAPQAGDKFQVMENEREAKEIANRREQILREQSIRTTRRLTLSDIGRRLALGNFQQLNLILKGDVDGSVEALSDSLLKLSTEEIKVNVIQKAVGQITETDVNLAAVSDAIIIGFQVRPSASARKLAEQEQVEMRLYSIIYDAINEVKDAMEGMLAPKIEEVIIGNLEIRQIFKISKIGTIAGCYVLDGHIKRHSKIRIVRDGIVVHTGEVDALKRFKDDVAEVKSGYECGLSVKNFNDLLESDLIEVFEFKEVKRTL